MSLRRVRLGDLGSWGSGGTPLASNADYYGGEIPWLIIEDLNDGIVHRSARTISQLGLENSSAKIVPAGTLLIAMYGSIGKLGITAISCATNQAIAFCRCDPKRVNTKFLFYMLLHERKGLLRAGRGGTQQNISQEFLKGYEIRLPNLSEQSRIAALLEKADRLCGTRRYALELSEPFPAAAFLEVFGDPASNPRTVPTVQVEELFAKDREGTKCGPFGSALKKHEYVAQGIPVWTMDNFSTNKFQETGCLYISESKYRDLAAYSVKSGDILISRAGTVGRMAIVRTKHERSIIHTNLIRLALDHERILPVLFVTLMRSFGSRMARLKRGQEDAYTFMSTGSLGELRIPLPPMELQQKFAKILAQHERLRARQAEAQRQADHLFQSLLHEAFTADA